MVKLLHSADWHLDAPLGSLSREGRELLRREQLRLPGRVARLCREEGCGFVLLSGDIFDGKFTPQSLGAVRDALEEMAVPVFIAPGNHDWFWEGSPWNTGSFPGNVHIFKTNEIGSVALEELDCRVYGAGFTGPEAGALLAGFRAGGSERHAVMVLHGDALAAESPYCPVTRGQIMESGLDYLALGHIHSRGEIFSGGTLAAWPGCGLGRGFDETGEKGALIVTLGHRTEAEFRPIPGPRFYDWEVPGDKPLENLLSRLPGKPSRDFFRVSFTGQAEPPDLKELCAALTAYPNLTLRDRTVPPMDLWAGADEDSLEGTFFRILRDARRGQDGETVRALELAAKISRQILLGQEVILP